MKNMYKLLYHDKNEMVKFKMESTWRSNLAFINKYFNNLRHWRHEHLKNYPLSLEHDPYFDFTHIKSYEIKRWETLVAFCENKICEIFSCFDMETYFCPCRSGQARDIWPTLQGPCFVLTLVTPVKITYICTTMIWS